MKIEFLESKTIVDVPADHLLQDMSFAIEAVINNFLGRKITSFDCVRKKDVAGNAKLIFTTNEKGQMSHSSIMTLGLAVQEGVFPKNISNSFMEKQDVVNEGVYQHSSKKFSETVMNFEDLNPNISLSFISYGLSDIITGLFAMGCTFIKWQGSLKKTQLFFRHAFSESTLKEFLNSKIDYNLKRQVKTLKLDYENDT